MFPLRFTAQSFAIFCYEKLIIGTSLSDFISDVTMPIRTESHLYHLYHLYHILLRPELRLLCLTRFQELHQ
jgi:hypothetical protein